MRVLLTIPAHNEAETIQGVISSFMEESRRQGLSIAAQVIDDNSTDGTFERVCRMGIPVHRVIGGTGLAHAFRTEMIHALATDAEYFLHVDGDGQHRSSDLHAFVQNMEVGSALILGNRLHTKPPGMTDVRFDANILVSRIVSALVGLPISDSQTGYRAIRRDVAEKCWITSTYTYTQEQIVRAAFYGFTIAEVPIYVDERITGASRLVRSPLQYLARAFRDLEMVVQSLDLERGSNG